MVSQNGIIENPKSGRLPMKGRYRANGVSGYFNNLFWGGEFDVTGADGPFEIAGYGVLGSPEHHQGRFSSARLKYQCFDYLRLAVA